MIRPTFAAAWAASTKTYDPARSGERVAQVIGGSVAAHIRDKKNPRRMPEANYRTSRAYFQSLK